MKPNLLFIPAFILMLASCGNSNTANNNNGPIILGDSSTIVTERDSQYLKDDMQDWEPKKAATTTQPEAKPATEAATAKVEEPPVAKEPVKENVASGYTISFSNIKIVFEGITANDASRQNPEKQDGLSYIVKSGDIENSKIHIYGAKDATVKQRYQSRLTLHSNLGTVDLRNLGLYMSGWKAAPNAKSGGQAFSLNDLNDIEFSTVNNNKIKNATDRELRNRRTNRKVIESWMKEISRTRSANDKPCEVILDNVQLQISGTGADGKVFRKNIRMSV